MVAEIQSIGEAFTGKGKIVNKGSSQEIFENVKSICHERFRSHFFKNVCKFNLCMLHLMKQQFVHHFERDGIFHTTKCFPDPYIQQMRLEGQDKRIIVVGAGGYNPIPGAINVDPYRNGIHSIRAFGEKLPFCDNTFDTAICSAVLEHIKEPQLVVNEMYRILKPGGDIYITVPFLQPYHAAPNDYQRWTITGVKTLMQAFEEIDSGISVGPGSTVTWILVEYVQIFFDNHLLKKLFKNLAKIILSPLKYFDAFFIHKKSALLIANGFYFYGKCPPKKKL